MQQLEALVDVGQLHGVRDVLVHAKFAIHVVPDQLGNVLARLEAPKRGAPPHAACIALGEPLLYYYNN